MKLSIIVPIYNAEEYLDNTLKMLANICDRFPKDLEVVLVNDGSTDNSLNIIKKFSVKNENFQVVTYDTNFGVSVARNKGIMFAKGKYVTFFDSDDEIKVDNFKNILNLMTRFDVIYTDFERNENIAIDEKNRYQIMQIIYRVQGKSTAGVNSKFYRRDFLIKNSIFFPKNVVFNEDSFFALKSLKYAKNLKLTTNKFYIIKTSHTLPYFNEKLWDSNILLAKKLDELFYQDVNSFEIQNIKDKIHIDIIIPLIDRYFGPLVQKKRMTINEVSQQLKLLNKKIDFSDSCKNNKWVVKFRFRYRVICRLMSFKLYRTVIIFNNLMDKIRKYNRFKD